MYDFIFCVTYERFINVVKNIKIITYKLWLRYLTKYILEKLIIIIVILLIFNFFEK